jgi:glycosyltransferase involved in cell wall biosynthesis
MVVHAYYPLGETRVEREALALLDHDFKVDVICLQRQDEKAVEVVDGINVYRLPVRRRRGSGLIKQFWEYLSFFVIVFFHLSKIHLQERYDVIQVHNLPDFLVLSALVTKFTGAKIVLDLHDLMPEFYSERSSWSMQSLPVRIVRLQERAACAFADHIITVTNTWRKALIKRGQPSNKLSVVMNLADNRFFYFKGTRKSNQSDRFNLIYHGIMGRRHGLDLALLAINNVRKHNPKVHLTLHGGGEEKQKLEDMVAELGLEEHVTFSSNFVPTNLLVELIRLADVGIVPYRNDVFTGGILPTKLMEYAALGIPTIVARTSCISKYFDENMVAYFEPGNVDELADNILKLSVEKNQLIVLANNIKIFNERYNWKDHQEKYVQIIQDLVGN